MRSVEQDQDGLETAIVPFGWASYPILSKLPLSVEAKPPVGEQNVTKNNRSVVVPTLEEASDTDTSDSDSDATGDSASDSDSDSCSESSEEGEDFCSLLTMASPESFPLSIKRSTEEESYGWADFPLVLEVAREEKPTGVVSDADAQQPVLTSVNCHSREVGVNRAGIDFGSKLADVAVSGLSMSSRNQSPTHDSLSGLKIESVPLSHTKPFGCGDFPSVPKESILLEAAHCSRMIDSPQSISKSSLPVPSDITDKPKRAAGLAGCCSHGSHSIGLHSVALIGNGMCRTESLHRCCKKARKNTGRHVSFATVEIQEYSRALGDHPWSSGFPLSIDWQHSEKQTMSLNEYEAKQLPKFTRRMPPRRLSEVERRFLLISVSGVAASDLVRQERRRRLLAERESSFQFGVTPLSQQNGTKEIIRSDTLLDLRSSFLEIELDAD